MAGTVAPGDVYRDPRSYRRGNPGDRLVGKPRAKDKGLDSLLLHQLTAYGYFLLDVAMTCENRSDLD